MQWKIGTFHDKLYTRSSLSTWDGLTNAAPFKSHVTVPNAVLAPDRTSATASFPPPAPEFKKEERDEAEERVWWRREWQVRAEEWLKQHPCRSTAWGRTSTGLMKQLPCTLLNENQLGRLGWLGDEHALASLVVRSWIPCLPSLVLPGSIVKSCLISPERNPSKGRKERETRDQQPSQSACPWGRERRAYLILFPQHQGLGERANEQAAGTNTKKAAFIGCTSCSPKRYTSQKWQEIRESLQESHLGRRLLQYTER